MQIERYEPGMDRKYISDCVAALWGACNTYGKPCDGALLQGWEIVLKLHRINREEFSRGMEHYIGEGGDMPTPGAFGKWVIAQREAWQLQALVEATYLHERQINATYRQALVDQGINPDELIPIAEAAESLSKIESRQKELSGQMKALPDSSNWADPEQEAKIRAQLEAKQGMEAQVESPA